MPEVISLPPKTRTWSSWFLTTIWLGGFGLFIWNGQIYWAILSIASFMGWFLTAGANSKRISQFCLGMFLGTFGSCFIEGCYEGAPELTKVPVYAVATFAGAFYGLYRSSFNEQTP